MFGRKNKAITARSAGELDAMEAAGRIVGEALVAVRSAAKPGMSTLDLDEIAEDIIRGADAIPSFKGYEGFPGSVCTSVNDVVVHGIPSSAVILSEGDLVSIDCGAILDGWHGDSAWTFGIGELSATDTALNDATAQVLAEGLRAMTPGNRLTDVSAALARQKTTSVSTSTSWTVLADTGSAARCMRIRTFPTKAGEGVARRLLPARCWRSSRCSPAGQWTPRPTPTTGRFARWMGLAPRIGSTPSRPRIPVLGSSPRDRLDRSDHSSRRGPSGEPPHFAELVRPAYIG